MDVGLRLLVPELHVRRGDEDLVRAVARAGDVGRRAVERNRKDDDARFVEVRRGGRGAAELADADLVVLKRQIHSLPRSARAAP